ncbi:MAG: NADH-quinone oxidoreductase subunit [Dehalococcoidia bacterium]|nr:NADH-quinone oxidoreductase subunit [Dehalococcoidia bacterium]
MTWLDVLLVGVSIGAFAIFISVVVMGLTWIERKVMAHLQARRGPTKTGPFGLLQPIADAIKLLSKEDFMPGKTDKLSFWIAPVVVFAPAFMVWVTIPFTRNIVIANLDLGLLYILAIMGVSIVGMLMAGWASANKYSALGGARAAAQLISYELPMVLGVLGVVMIAGTADLRGIVGSQNVPFILLQPLGFVLVFLAGLAEVGRTPFDIPFAESELMGGPFLEYSGIHWAMFQLAEYAGTFLVAILSTLLFLGGWRGPWSPADGIGAEIMMAFWLFSKAMVVFMVIIWIRATIPRFRIDQLMGLAWKVFVPLSFVNVLITAFYLFYHWPDWTITVMSLATLGATWWLINRGRRKTPRPSLRTVKVMPRVAATVAAAPAKEAAPAAGTAGG